MAASIKPIDTTSVHRIHSGQVVLDLQSCLKELVENALDAGATSIDVRIKDSGTTSIEVVDNGSGISSADWEFIGLKHHTSKLPDLTLLHDVTTFGFRGEALSALCALCESVTVVTSTKEMEPMGAVIQLGRDGRVLDDTGKIARPRGTTITLTNLFAPLPVRRKEFERNAKKELTKALTLLTAYALVPASCTSTAPGIRLKFDCLTTGKTSKRNSMLSNDGRGDLRANVMAVWGSKALDGVIDVDLDLEVAVDRMARREGIEDGKQTVKVKGLLSSAAWAQGRSSADRQFFYVNGRPADLKVIQKVVNEVYKSFNTHQVPLAVLDFSIPRESVDINVSPDKRTLMLHSESNLLSALRLGLEQYFAPSRSTFAVDGATQMSRALKATQSKLTLIPQSTSAAPQEAHVVSDDPENEEMEGTPDAPPAQTDITRSRSSSLTTTSAERRRPQNAQAGPSKPRAQVITILDEDEDESLQSTLPSRPSSRSTRQPSPPQAAPLVAPPAISPASPARKRVQGSLKTSAASWSPDRKLAGGRKVTSGTEARKSLRERLKVYSQSQMEPDGAEDEEGRGDDVGDEDDDEGSGQEISDEEKSDDDELMVISPPGQTRGKEPIQSEGEEEMDVDMQAEEEDGQEDMDGAAGNEDAEPGAETDPVIQVQKAKRIPGAANGVVSDVLPAEAGRASIAPKRKARPSEILPSFTPSPSTTSTAINTPHPKRPRAATSSTTATILAPTETIIDDDAQPSRGVQTYRSEIVSSTTTGEVTISFSLPRLQSRYAYNSRRRPSAVPNGASDTYSKLTRSGVTAEAGIANRDMHSAEEALSRVISKDDFGLMEVVGQFNKGFIIARLAKRSAAGADADDLFIIDQHATDEKFNFETLQNTTQIKGQALIKPRPLELTAADELTAIENLSVLKANGFEVDVDEEKPPGRGERVRLVAMPVSKDTVFDFKDLEQLLHLLSDSSHATGQMVRCTKARSMFAMRACRKSVMIGKSLTKGQMTQLLRNMGTIDQPWNCPHGRPTMRHLTKIERKRCRTGHGRIDWTTLAGQMTS